jgi:tetratricopeptide (TPR) repeat protein
MRAPKSSKPTAGIVTSDTVRSHQHVSGPLTVHKKRAIFIGAGLLLLAIVAAGFIKLAHKPASPSDGNNFGYTISTKEYSSHLAKQMEKTPPAPGTPITDQREYYLGLMQAQFAAENYKDVVANYEKLTALLHDADLPLNPYIYAAESYAKLGDTSKAESVLSRAEAAEKNVTDSEQQTSDNAALSAAREKVHRES